MKKYFTKAFALHLWDNRRLLGLAIGMMVAWFSYLNWFLYR